MAVTLTGVALPRLYSDVPLQPDNCPGLHFLQGPPGHFLCPHPTPPPAPAPPPPPPEQGTPKSSRKDTVLAPNTVMPRMMVLL